MFIIGSRQANLCFHFAISGENLPDIAKSHGTGMDNKEFNSLLLPVLSQKLSYLVIMVTQLSWQQE